MNSNPFPPIERTDLFERSLPATDPTVCIVKAARLGFAPGQPAGRHRPTVTTIGVVTSGQFRFQPEGEEIRLLNIGDTFLEAAGQVVAQFDNASDRESAEIFCFYLTDTVDRALLELIENGEAVEPGQ